MSETEKNCGNCLHYANMEDGESNPCEHPIVKSFGMRPFPSSIYIVYVYANDGKHCPCHEPREEK